MIRDQIEALAAILSRPIPWPPGRRALVAAQYMALLDEAVNPPLDGAPKQSRKKRNGKQLARP